VSISVGGKRKSLGYFTDEEKAGRAYDTYVVDNNLDRPLNFPVAAEEEDGESLSEDEKEESPRKSDDAGEDYGAAAAAAPAAKRRKTSTRAPRAVATKAASASAAKKPKAAASKTSRFHGVTWRKDIKMWRLTINIGGVTKYMAHFYEEDKAARTFDKVVVRNKFDFSLNFPDDAVKQEEASS
jgi:hypothetical protein